MAQRLPEDESAGMSVARWLYMVLVFVLALLLIPLLLPISGLFRLYRTFLVDKVKKKLGEDVMMATGNDAVWLQDTPNNRAIINAILSVKGTPNLEKCRQLVVERMIERTDPDAPTKPLFPKLTMYSAKVLRRFVWLKEADFKIEEHIHMYDKPIRNNHELQEEVGKICSRELPKNKAPWEVILFEPMSGSDEYIIAFRLHHSVGDGISLVRSFSTCLADKPPEDIRTSHRFGAQGKSYLKIAKTVLEAPGTLVSRVFKLMNKNVLHGPTPSGTKVVAWTKQIDLELIKRIKNATGTTVNDVLFSVLAGTLGEYMSRHSSSPPTDICASVPVDIRRSRKLEMDNQFAVVFVDLPLDEADPVRCLRRMKKRMDLLKASPEPLINNLVISLCMARMPNWLSELALNWLTDKCSMVVSNVPGPAVPLSVSGQLIDDLLFWPPQRKNVGR
jgi:diacylglycerol O-acyltransferase